MSLNKVYAFAPSERQPDDSSAGKRLAIMPSDNHPDTSSSRGAACGFGRPLTNSKHEHFARLVSEGQSPAQAYVLCGYSRNGALPSSQRLLGKPEVRARVEELKAAMSEREVEKTAVDRDWVMARLVENVNRAMQVEPVRDREGHPTGHYTYQGGVANKALELLGGRRKDKPSTEPRSYRLY